MSDSVPSIPDSVPTHLWVGFVGDCYAPVLCKALQDQLTHRPVSCEVLHKTGMPADALQALQKWDKQPQMGFAYPAYTKRYVRCLSAPPNPPNPPPKLILSVLQAGARMHGQQCGEEPRDSGISRQRGLGDLQYRCGVLWGGRRGNLPYAAPR